MTNRRQTAGILIGCVWLKIIDSTSCAGFILTTFVKAAKKNYYKREHCPVASDGDLPFLQQNSSNLQTINHFKTFYPFCLVSTDWEIQSWERAPI